jgi:anti-sigma B factor antagonist
MDPVMLEEIGKSLYRLVDEEDRRKIVLDFEKVQYLSSQAIGIILTLHKKMASLKHSRLVLCSVGPKLMELLKITRLDRILTIKPTQAEATKAFDAI